MALAAAFAVATPATAQQTTANATGYTAVLNVGNDLYVQPWDGTKFPVKSAAQGGRETAAKFTLPAISDWLDQPSSGQVIDQATGLCLGPVVTNQFGGNGRVGLQNCDGSPGQKWYFRFNDAARTSFLMTDNSMLSLLGASEIVSAIDNVGGIYPASGTLYKVETRPEWPNSPYVYSQDHSASNLTPIH